MPANRMDNDAVANGEGGGERPYWSPYVAGFGLGIALLLSFVVLGAGLGASGGLARCGAWLENLVAPAHTGATEYFGPWVAPGGPHPLAYYLVFMGVGTLIGAFISARASGRIRLGVERGPRISAAGRLVAALLGGVLVGFASRLARGCTSGLALTGTALLIPGGILFLVCIFAGAYAAAFFVRREWL